MKYEEIPIEKIDPNPRQPRQVFDEEKLEELAASIQKVGLLQPVLVRPMNERFELVHGERRVRACKIAEFEKIKAEVRDLSDRETLEIALSENLQREDINPLEEAEGFQTLAKEFNYTHEDISDKVGKSRTYVTNRLRLLKLPEKVRENVRRLTLSPGHAEPLLRYYKLLKKVDESDKARFEAFSYPLRKKTNLYYPKKNIDTSLNKTAEKIANNNISVKEVREFVKTGEECFDRACENRQKDGNLYKKMKEKGWDEYIPAVENDEVKCNYDVKLWKSNEEKKDYYNNLENLELGFESLEQEFTGQETHFPKYSGQKIVDYEEYRAFDEIKNIPIFTKEEWEEINEYADKREEIFNNKFPEFEPPAIGSDYSLIVGDATTRRTYDPNYGDCLVDGDKVNCICGGGENPIFVKKGWGSWKVVEFNDGEGDRVKRRFFEQDHIASSLVRNAIETVHPDMFSDKNFRKLNLWNVQETKMSWWYIRKETVKREDVIEAMKNDLERIKDQDSMSDDELKKKSIDVLKKHHIEAFGRDPRSNREIIVSMKRLPDGSQDNEKIKELLD